VGYPERKAYNCGHRLLADPRIKAAIDSGKVDDYES
jgi:phage terminase small subunit